MNQEAPDFKRLLLAVFLMTALLMGYNALFAPKVSKELPSKEAAPTAEPIKAPAPKAPVTVVPDSKIPVVEKSFTQSGYKVTFTSKGAQAKSFVLTNYETPIDLPPHWDIESRDTGLTLFAQSRYKLASSTDNSITFKKRTPENVEITRSYQLGSKPFVINQSVEFKNLSNSAQALSLNWLTETHESKESKEEQLAVTLRVSDEQKRIPFSDLAEKSETFSGSPAYIAFDRRYFLMSLSPIDNANIESVNASSIPSEHSKHLRLRMSEKTFILPAKASKTYTFSSYIGPKESKYLQEAGPYLTENLDYGWFGVLSRPLLWLLIWINQWVMNFGIAIILLTVLIKILTFPLTQKSFAAQQQMKKIAPKLKELQKKYAHDKAALGQQQMAFYKEEGINPMAGCLPILIQMPVWFALYQMLGNSAELFEQPFFGWITDLTRPDPYYITPILMGVSMMASQWIMPPTIDESQPQMKYVLWFMPIFLTFIMLNLPAGLSIYMLVNNLLTIGQQMYIKKRYET